MYRKLSEWKLPLQSVTKISSKWQHFRHNDTWISSGLILLTTVKLSSMLCSVAWLAWLGMAPVSGACSTRTGGMTVVIGKWMRGPSFEGRFRYLSWKWNNFMRYWSSLVIFFNWPCGVRRKVCRIRTRVACVWKIINSPQLYRICQRQNSDVTRATTENNTSSLWQLRRHWWHRKLSKWQLTTPTVTTKLSKWRSLVSSEMAVTNHGQWYCLFNSLFGLTTTNKKYQNSILCKDSHTIT